MSLSASQYAVALALLAILDSAWITCNKTLYGDAIQAVQKRPLRLHTGAAAAAYVCIYALLVLFAIPSVKRKGNLRDAAWHGGLLGLFTYGTYNFTSMSIYSEYPLDVALRDTLWGGVLFTLVTFVTLQFP